MEIRILATPDEIARVAADVVEEALEHTSVTIGLAAGATPLPTYRELVTRHRVDSLQLAPAQFVLLDEYVGLPPSHPASFYRNLSDQFAAPAEIPLTSLHGPDGDSGDPAAACAAYEQLLTDLPRRRLQLLGIGSNGHIGFNEPGAELDSRTHVVELHESTRRDNQRHFPEGQRVPTHAITMGIGTLLEADRMLLLATGARKAGAIAQALGGPVTSHCPASALQLHGDVVVLLDPPAAAAL